MKDENLRESGCLIGKEMKRSENGIVLKLDVKRCPKLRIRIWCEQQGAGNWKGERRLIGVLHKWKRIMKHKEYMHA